VPSAVPAAHRHAAAATLVAAQLDLAFWHAHYSDLTAAGSRAAARVPPPETHFAALCLALPSAACARAAVGAATCAALHETFDLDLRGGALALPVRSNPLLAVLQVRGRRRPLRRRARDSAST